MLRRLISAVLVSSVLGVGLAVTACVPQPRAAPAQIRTTPPPWPAPRDAISYIEAAQLEPLSLDHAGYQRTLTVRVVVNGSPVVVPPYIGIDRIRAVQASAHTHDTSGTVWIEGKQARQVTLGQFFTLWGVRLTPDCIGGTCGQLRVSVDRRRMTQDPRAIVLDQAHQIDLRLSTS